MLAKWERVGMKGDGPGPRSSHSVSWASGKLWVVGGEAKAREPAGMDVFTLELDAPAPPAGLSGTWRKYEAGSDALPPRNAHAQAAIGPCLYVFGGRRGLAMEEAALNDLWRFDTARGQWEGPLEAARGEPPAPRSYHTACAAAGKLYIFGGCGEEGRLADLHEYDPEARAWRPLPSPPDLAGRGGATLEPVAGEGALLLFSGYCGGESRDTLTFDLASETWTVRHGPECSHCPCSDLEPRSVCASLVAPCTSHREHAEHGKPCTGPTPCSVLVFGGEIAPSERGHEGAGSFAGDLVAFDGEGHLIPVETRGPGPQPRGWAAMSAMEAGPHEVRGVLFGGLAGDDRSPTRLEDVWVLTVSVDA